MEIGLPPLSGLDMAGVFERLFNILSDVPDMEMAMIDGTIVKVHRHGQGSKGDLKSGDRQVEGRLDDQDSALRDALGNLVRFVMLPA